MAVNIDGTAVLGSVDTRRHQPLNPCSAEGQVMMRIISLLVYCMIAEAGRECVGVLRNSADQP